MHFTGRSSSGITGDAKTAGACRICRYITSRIEAIYEATWSKTWSHSAQSAIVGNTQSRKPNPLPLQFASGDGEIRESESRISEDGGGGQPS